VVTVLLSIVVLLGVVLGGSYFYVRYEWNKIHKVACTSCEEAISGQPFNVLIIGSDSRAGDTGQAAESFGNADSVGGQRSDTIKIVRVDPSSGTARVLSIPRDTYVTMSGLAESTGLTGSQKINTAFNNGPNALIETIQNTFGIPINHFIIVNFDGVINSVDALGGISLNFADPVRDDDDGNNNSGLDIALPGCHLLNGNEALALSRSRYYQYYANGQWNMDPGYDISRIERQNTIIEAMVKKATSTYNPFTLHALLTSVVNDIKVDTNMSFSLLYDLAEKYHAFSPSSLDTFTLPTTGVEDPYGEDVEVVNTQSTPTYVDTITQFLGEAPGTVSTPPLDQYGDPVSVPTPTTTTTIAPSATTTTGKAQATTPTTAPVTTTTLPSYDPTLC
jgi:LCP family protein required for cell wall assembly